MCNLWLQRITLLSKILCEVNLKSSYSFLVRVYTLSTDAHPHKYIFGYKYEGSATHCTAHKRLSEGKNLILC